MKKIYRKLEIDLWKTSKFKRKTIGIKKKEQFMSKSRQFTRGMDLIGAIREKDKKTGYLGIRKGIDRLVIKAFSGPMGWQGTLEESVAREVIQSHVLGHKFPSLVIVIPGYEYLIVLEKNEGGLGQRETYAMCLFNENGVAQWFTLKKKRISWGDDWDIKNMQGKKVARIDGKVADVGGRWDVEIYAKKLSKDKRFVMALVLFAAFRRYEKKVEKRISNILKEVKMGKEIKIQHKELRLFENPRSVIK